MSIFAVRANLKIWELRDEVNPMCVDGCGELFVLSMQGQLVPYEMVEKMKKGNVLLGFKSLEEAEEFVKTQAQPLGNLKEMITVSLNRQLRDRYIVFQPLAGWIHEFKIEPKESETRPERLNVYFCLDLDLGHLPTNFCGISTHEHSAGCSRDVRAYPFCSDPLATFEPCKDFQVFESKAAYLASLTDDHTVKPVPG